MKFYSFMALFGFNSHRYKMLMSVCFTCLCNSTHRKLRCVASLVGTYKLVDDIGLRARSGNACVRICTPRCYWLDRESSYKRLSQLALDLMASPASQAYAERCCVVI